MWPFNILHQTNMSSLYKQILQSFKSPHSQEMPTKNSIKLFKLKKKISSIQHQGPMWSLWQSQQLQVVSSPLLPRTRAPLERLLANGGVRVLPLTHWIRPCLAAAPFTAHKGEFSPPVSSFLLRPITFENPFYCLGSLKADIFIL